MKKIYYILILIIGLTSSCAEDVEIIETGNLNNFGGVFNISLNTQAKIIVPAYLSDRSSSQISSQVFEGLIKFSPKNLSIEKGIVKRWTVDNTGLVYKFILHDNVYFHDDVCFVDGKGRNVTTEDVKYTIYTLATKSIYNKNFSNTVNNIKGARKYYEASTNGVPNFDIEGFKIIDDYTFEITLTKRNFPLIEFLATPAAAIIPKEGIEMYHEKNLIGCGPFKVSEITDGKPIVLVRNDKYFKIDKKENYLPYMDTIIVHHVRSSSTQLKLLEKGELDIALGLNDEEVTSFLESHIMDFKSKTPKYKVEPSELLGNNSLQNIMRADLEGFYTNSYNYLDFSLVNYKK